MNGTVLLTIMMPNMSFDWRVRLYLMDLEQLSVM